MENETPVESETVAVETKPKRAARAKPQIEVEAEKKAAEAARARTVGRAAPLIESGNGQIAGSPDAMVTCRVLNKGEGRIHTGEIDPDTRRPSFFAAGETFETTERSAMQHEARGYAERQR